MSTPEQPDTPALTRKQLREIRNTGATPIVTAEAIPPSPEPEVEEAVADDAVDEIAPDPEPPVIVAPRPRAAQPAMVTDIPMPDANVDLGVSPLTRRQARQQERIRTASVPVITPDIAASHAAPAADAAETAEDELEELVVIDDQADAEHSVETESEPATDSVDADDDDDNDPLSEFAPVEAERAIVNPKFGADLLAGEVTEVQLPPSFDQLITRSMTGAVGTGNALILSQTPSAPNLVAPVTATGEVLITGTLNLPEGLGSTGHAVGTADSKETDAVLIDGELPAHSSPTPIAASAAISTVKNSGDIIKPPVPEKGSRLLLALAITAGVLGLALVGVLILMFATGVI